MTKLRITAFALVIALMLVPFALVVSSAAEPRAVTAGEAVIPAGETGTVELYLEGDVPVSYLALTVECDAPISLLSAVNGELFDTLDAGVNLIFSSDDDVDGDGLLAKLSVAVAEGTPRGQYTFDIIFREAYDQALADVAVTVATVTVTVPCSHESTHSTEGRAPTCTDEGIGEGSVCDECGATVTSGESIPALGHTPGEWRVYSDGEGRFCTVCDELIESRPLTGGDPAVVTTVVIVAVVLIIAGGTLAVILIKRKNAQ